MIPELAYLLKVNVAFVFFYAFYRLFFYKDTFFKLRRAILLAFFGVSLLYPLLNIQEWLQEQAPMAGAIGLYTAILPEVTVTNAETAQPTDWQQVIHISAFCLYWGGVLFLLLRFCVQLGSILWLAYKSPKEHIHGKEVHVLNKPAGPFSFFKLIFLHPDSHSEKEIDEILTHEGTHVSQWHSIDVVVCELISIVCWMNPFAWLLKREVRHNLEYLADNTVIRSGYDSKSYQYHLLGLAHHQAAANLYNSFNVLHLKNRISMMNKKRSRGIGRTKYLLFLPLTALLMLLSNCMQKTSENEEADASEEVNAKTETAPVASEEAIIEEAVIKGSKVMTEEELGGQVFTVVEVMPRYPGGDGELLSFIAKSVKYPVVAQEKGIQGRVICQFVVTKEGDIVNIEVIRGIDPLLDQEAVRVLGEMPKWTPGTQRGQKVPVKYTVPITFRLEGGPSGTKELASDAGKPGEPMLTENSDPSNPVYKVVEVMPRYPGGDEALLKFLAASIKYPKEAQEKGVKGRVIASFVVTKDGNITDINVLRSVDSQLDAEAVRVIKSMPKWAPGTMAGKPVNVLYTVPITFRLQ